MHNGLQLPHLLQPPPEQPVAMQIAQPLNDVQLVALVAATATFPSDHNREPSAKEKVENALNIVAEAIVQTKTLPELVRAKQRRLDG